MRTLTKKFQKSLEWWDTLVTVCGGVTGVLLLLGLAEILPAGLTVVLTVFGIICIYLGMFIDREIEKDRR